MTVVPLKGGDGSCGWGNRGRCKEGFLLKKDFVNNEFLGREREKEGKVQYGVPPPATNL